MTTCEGFERIGTKAGALARIVEGATGLAAHESFVVLEHTGTLAVVATILVVPGCAVVKKEKEGEEN